MKIIETINPSNDQLLDSFEFMDDAAVELRISKANNCFSYWKKSSLSERKKLMHSTAEILLLKKKKFANCISLEMGKTYLSALAEIEKCAWLCRFYADSSEALLADEIVKTDAQKSMVTYQPLGVLLAIMPWNYPFWQVFRFAVPMLMAGNTAVLKHASSVPQSALFIEEIFREAGFPEYAFSTLIIHSSQVEKIIHNSLIKAISLTGSEKAGATVASHSGAALKKTILELGGNDAYIILKDADLELAVRKCTESRLLNAGQSCIGAKRFIVVESMYEPFLRLFKESMQAKIMGDPFDEKSEYGPLARKDLRDEVHQQVLDSIAKGANLEIGGYIPEGSGCFYPATILTNVQVGMPAYEEEIFGPVAAVIKVANEKEAIEIANDSKYGLGACIFTKDQARGEAIAKYEIEAGCCFVNEYVKSDPRLPFGGIKSSGYGRELSHYGLREFVNIKTVYIS